MTIKQAGTLIGQIPRELLDQIGQELNIDKSVSHLYGNIMFDLLIFGMLRSERLSTRVLEELYNSAYFQAFSTKGAHKTRHSSLASRLDKLPYEYFEQIYQWSIEHFGKHLKSRPKWLEKVTAFDSTLIAIGGGLVDWGMRVGRKPKDGPGKVQLKITLGYTGILPSSVKVFQEQKDLSEERALQKAIVDATHRSKDLIAFDQGLKKRKTLATFDNDGIHFVTRAIEKVRYQVLEPHKKIKGRKANGLRFIQDSKVYLYTDGHQVLKHPFRLIEVEILDPKEGQPERLIFLTNIWELSAMEIAQIYRKRWGIEVFFRFLKQELNLKHLINRSLNGIMIQLYSALITSILIVTFKKINKIEGYKIAKIRFEDQLMLAIVKELKKIPPLIRKRYGVDF